MLYKDSFLLIRGEFSNKLEGSFISITKRRGTIWFTEQNISATDKNKILSLANTITISTSNRVFVRFSWYGTGLSIALPTYSFKQLLDCHIPRSRGNEFSLPNTLHTAKKPSYNDGVLGSS
jgi:hypothetical protein